MRNERGFTLIEVLGALTLLTLVGLSVSAALVTGRALAARDRAQVVGRIAAAARLATLAALAFDTAAAADGSPVVITDTTTDVAADPPGPGGTGLAVSPLDALWVDRAGYVDYLDGRGRGLGTGAGARDRAAYVRRWTVGRAGAGPGELVTIAVLVAPMAAAARAADGDPTGLAVQGGVVVRRGARMRQAS